MDGLIDRDVFTILMVFAGTNSASVWVLTGLLQFFVGEDVDNEFGFCVYDREY